MKQKIKITREQIEQALCLSLASYANIESVIYKTFGDLKHIKAFPDFIEIEVDVPEERLIVGYSDATTWDAYSKKVNDDFSNLAAVLQVKIRDEVADAIDSLEKRVEKLESAFNSKADQPVCINGNDYDINCMDEKCPVHFRYLRGDHE